MLPAQHHKCQNYFYNKVDKYWTLYKLECDRDFGVRDSFRVQPPLCNLVGQSLGSYAINWVSTTHLFQKLGEVFATQEQKHINSKLSFLSYECTQCMWKIEGAKNPRKSECICAAEYFQQDGECIVCQIPFFCRDNSMSHCVSHQANPLVFEHIELPAKLLDYFSGSNKSKINQSHKPKTSATHNAQMLPQQYNITFTRNHASRIEWAETWVICGFSQGFWCY